MSKHFSLIAILLVMFTSMQSAKAAFILKNRSVEVLQMQVDAPSSTGKIMNESPSTIPNTLSAFSRHKEKSGALAYISAGCGVLGFAIASIHTTFIMLILGTIAGIAGKMGMKAYRGRNGLRALSIIGLVLGAILVLYATVPLLFLI